MRRLGLVRTLAFLSLFFLSTAAWANFTECLTSFRNNDTLVGGTDHKGDPVNDPKLAVGLTYKACISLCGREQEKFDWTIFSQQFSAWLLPWLALVSQIPFGAENRLDNLISGQFPRTHISDLTSSLTMMS